MAKRTSKKVSKFRYWTKQEIQILRKFNDDLTNRQLARKLKRSPKAIQTKALTLGLHKVRQKWWTETEIKRLRKLYGNRGNTQIARMMRRTVRSVEIKASKLGLKKTKARLRHLGYTSF